MSPLWLLPIVILLATLPFLVAATRTLRSRIDALQREVLVFRGELQPALARIRHDGSRLARHHRIHRS